MVDRLPWALLGISHLVRTFVDDWGVQDLKTELAHLRVEVHRTRQLLEDYRAVLDSCERDLKLSRQSGQLLSTGNILAGFLLVVLWCLWKYQSFRAETVEAFEPIYPDPQPSEALVVRKKGPKRPSDLAERAA